MTIRSILKPEGSVTAAIATAGTVYAVYASQVGPVSQAHAADPNHKSLESSRKKAGYISFILVSALSLITKDGNVATLGYASIVAMEVAYRQGIMADPNTGTIVAPTATDYEETTGGAAVIPMPAPDSYSQGASNGY